MRISYLTQVVSHHSAGAVARFLEESRQGRDQDPGHFRSLLLSKREASHTGDSPPLFPGAGARTAGGIRVGKTSSG